MKVSVAAVAMMVVAMAQEGVHGAGLRNGERELAPSRTSCRVACGRFYESNCIGVAGFDVKECSDALNKCWSACDDCYESGKGQELSDCPDAELKLPEKKERVLQCQPPARSSCKVACGQFYQGNCVGNGWFDNELCREYQDRCWAACDKCYCDGHADSCPEAKHELPPRKKEERILTCIPPARTSCRVACGRFYQGNCLNNPLYNQALCQKFEQQCWDACDKCYCDGKFDECPEAKHELPQAEN